MEFEVGLGSVSYQDDQVPEVGLITNQIGNMDLASITQLSTYN